MRKSILFAVAVLCCSVSISQVLKEKEVPGAVKDAMRKKFTGVNHVSWEKEKGNFEANWGGKSGEEYAALFSPAGEFMEIVHSISVKNLPASILPYVKKHFGTVHISEAGKISCADGREGYELEIKGKDLLFDKEGKYIGTD